MKCSKCGGRVAKTTEFDVSGLVDVEACQICGNRRYSRSPKPPEGKWSPYFPAVAHTSTRHDKETFMAKKTCIQCEREMNIIGRGLCGGCYYKEKSKGTLDANYPLPAAKTRKQPLKKQKNKGAGNKPVLLQDLPPATAGRIKGLEDKINHMKIAETAQTTRLKELQESTSGPGTTTAIPVCEIEFAPRDKELYDDLVKSAEYNRRNLASEILCRLDALKIIGDRK